MKALPDDPELTQLQKLCDKISSEESTFLLVSYSTIYVVLKLLLNRN